MKFRADISQCEDIRDAILSVCQCGTDGGIEHQLTIHRGPKEYAALDDQHGPKVSCKDLGLYLRPGPDEIVFSGNFMTVILSGHEDIVVDISGLDDEEQQQLRTVAQALFE
jgi:hypothetical protein